MYPVSLGFKDAVGRINALLKNGHSAEALVTSVFTFEKTLRRSFQLALLARGFSLKQAGRLIKETKFFELKDRWDIYEKSHRGLPEFIGNADWQHVPKAVKMRNDLVHGNRVYKLKDCEEYANYMLKALSSLHEQVKKEYGRDPWTKLTGRIKPKLQWLRA